MLPRLRKRLHTRKRRRDRQSRLWHRTHKRGHARVAHREARAVHKLRRLIHRALRHRRPTVMYDSVDVTQIPSNAKAVAGYVGGAWPTFHILIARFPRAQRLSIAVNSDENAQCLDIEPGDASPADAPAWVKRQRARGVKRPVVYASVSAMDTVLGELEAHGIDRGEVRIWTAHYGHGKHRCGPHTCGEMHRTTADATQWRDDALGRTLDESTLSESFFNPK